MFMRDENTAQFGELMTFVNEYNLLLSTLLPNETMRVIEQANEVFVNRLKEQYGIRKAPNLRKVMQSSGMIHEKLNLRDYSFDSSILEI